MQHSEPEGVRGGLAAAGPPATQLKLLEAALATSSEGVIIVDAAGRLVFVNPAARTLVRQEITAALPLRDLCQSLGLHYPDGRPMPVEESPPARALRGVTTGASLLFLQPPDGRSSLINVTASPVYDEHGVLVGAVAAFRDLTAEQETGMGRSEDEANLPTPAAADADPAYVAEETEQEPLLTQLRRTNVRLVLTAAEAREQAATALRQEGEITAVFTAIADPVIVFDAEGVVSRANPAAHSIYGNDVVGLRRQDLGRRLRISHQDGRLVDVETLPAGRALHGETVMGERYTMVDVDGKTRTMVGASAPMLADGKIVGAVVVYHDVTNREARLAEIQRHREFLEKLVEHAPIAIAVTEGPDNRYVLVNPAYETLTRRTRAEMVGLPIAASFPSLAGQSIADLVTEVVRGGRNTSLHECLTAVEEGKAPSFWDLHLIPLQSPAGTTERVLLMGNDITAQVTARREIERIAAESEHQSEQMVMLLENLGEGVSVLDGDGNVILRNQAARELTGLSDEEVERLARCGHIAQIQIMYADGTPMPPEDWPIPRLLRDAHLDELETLMDCADGVRRALLASGSTVRDAEGAVELAIIVFRDITEQRELERTREEFVSLISHDLRQPLTTIAGMSQWLAQHLAKQPLEREAQAANVVVASAKRMSKMLQDLTESVRLESGRIQLSREPTDLFQLITEIVQRVGAPEERERVEVEAVEWVPPLAVDQARLERAIMNVLTNALKYSPAGKPVRVSVDRQGDEARIMIADQGPGIAAAEVAHLFERFYRARATEASEGLGLGLYIARLIVEAHGGRIWVESEVGSGCIFTMALPVARHED